MTGAEEAAALRRALQLSAEVLGSTSPNPPVGAVVLDAAGRAVGEGATQPPGGPHAEVVALRKAGPRAEGGTLVVTLEPCRHTGRTPPCTDAIRAAGLRRVVVGCLDPTEPAGGGAAVLRAAGLQVETGVLGEQAAAGPLRGWLHAQRTGRPFVTYKYAATLDGRVAAADGSSRWITGPQARADVHRLRARSDAVLVGIGTVLADDPQLTARPDGHPLTGRQPLRVVFDSAGRTPPGARVLDDGAATLLLTDRDVAHHDLAAGLALLHDRGVVHALLEGGPTLAAAFLRAGLVDRVVAYLAPALLGSGPAAVGDLGVGTIAGALRFVLEDVQQVGDDVRLTARPEKDGQ